MRAASLWILLCSLAATSPAQASSDPRGAAPDDETVLPDPKCARGECRPPRFRAVDEDDPKLAYGLPKPLHVAPRVQLAYRFLMVADPYGGSLPFHLVELRALPVSRYFRLGFALTAGAAPRLDAWLVDVGVSVGAQYPWRVTPFFDVGISGGAIGATIADRKLGSYEFRPTIEVGAELYVAGRFHLSVAVGWSHPVYGGVDANAIEAAVKAGRTPSYEIQNLAYDTATVRVGIGL